MDPGSWEEADKLLHHKRGGAVLNRRKIGNNTWLERRVVRGMKLGEYMPIAVKLHATDVVTYHHDGTLTLNTGGWYTVTTKDRLNRYAGPFSVYSDRGRWKVYTPNPSPQHPLWQSKERRHRLEYISYTLPMILSDLRGERIESGAWIVHGIDGQYGSKAEALAAQVALIGPEPPYDRRIEVGDFYDGIRLDPDNPTRYYDSPETAINEKHDEKIIALVDRYMKNLTPKKWDEVLSESDLGDCFICRAGHAFRDDDSDHLLPHLEERYYMRTLAWNAIAESGYRPEIYISDLKMVKRQLRKYFLSRLLQGNRQGRVGTEIEYKKGSWYAR